MYKRRFSKFYLAPVILLCILSSFSTPSYSGNEVSSDEISIIVDYIVRDTIPGEKPIGLSDDFLQKLISELKNPRLMSYEDLDEINKVSFISRGLTFVLGGDFNRDGIADVAFVGKYDSGSSEDTFLAIVSIKGKKVTRKFIKKQNSRQLLLDKVPKYKENVDAIYVTYNDPSEECFFLFWQDNKYVGEGCQAVFFD